MLLISANKCLSLHLSCFSSLHNNFGDSKWHYLTRYFMGTRLTRLDKRLDLIYFQFLLLLLIFIVRLSNLFNVILSNTESYLMISLVKTFIVCF